MPLRIRHPWPSVVLGHHTSAGLLSLELSPLPHTPPSLGWHSELNRKMLKDLLNREKVQSMSWWTSWAGLSGGGGQIPQTSDREEEVIWGEDHPQTTLHSLRGVLIFTVCDWFSAQGIFQHLPALGASIFQIRDLKRTPQPLPWLQRAGQLLATVLDKPLWERRPKPLTLLPREGRSPWQGPARPGWRSSLLSAWFSL